MGHILEIVNAAGDESARTEASEDKPRHNQPGEEAHLGLGSGGDVSLAVRTLHFCRRGIEEGHGADNHWLLEQDLAWRSLRLLNILLRKWSGTTLLGILHISFLESHPLSFISVRNACITSALQN